jgi:hypothetical protein
MLMISSCFWRILCLLLFNFMVTTLVYANTLRTSIFFLYIYYKLLIHSKVKFFLNPARRTKLCKLYLLCN